MKYGEQFEKESAPQWSLHNIDYNSLKHHIKVHTTKDQATAIAIPGHQDSALRVFEDELYAELCRQHDRVDMFVASKADEIGRRLQYLSNQIHRLLIRCAVSRRDRMSLKRQRLFSRYENELLQCGDDIQCLQRFVRAQVVAFRKILKKYKKWTGSSALGSRFRDTILTHPKSFTRRDFSYLVSEQENLLATLRDAFPAGFDRSASAFTESSASSIRPEQVSSSETIVVPESQQSYWNEYDHGSEAGDAEHNTNTYAIYINPDEKMSFPGVSAIAAIFTSPIRRVSKWMARHHGTDDERGQLLETESSHYGTTDASYFTQPPGGTLSDTEAENESNPTSARRGSYGYASSEEFPVGYKTYYAALPSLEEQYLIRYREQILFWGTWICFGVSFLLMGIAAVLIKTGRHRMRLEVDAGVTLGIMASLCAACAGLGMSFSRQERLRWRAVIGIWGTFAVTCVLNGILLVLVVGNTPLHP